MEGRNERRKEGRKKEWKVRNITDIANIINITLIIINIF